MADSKIEARLTEIFREVFDDEAIVLRPTMSAKDVDGWDSLTHVRLLLTIEKELKIRMSAHEMGSLKTVGDLVALCHSKLSSSPV